MALYRVVALRGDSASLELATSLVFEHGCLGTEETDDGGLELQAYFPSHVDLEVLSAVLRRSVPGVRAEVETPIPARDWLAEWKQSLSAFPLGERFHVVPTWIDVPDVDRTVLRIDPEQAFGTGTHETTRMSVELLERHVESGMGVVDLGTGTGILAMVAAKLGASKVVAIEPDPAACACAKANIARNGLRDRVAVACASWEAVRQEHHGLVVANINTAVLERAVKAILAPRIVLSGVLAAELDEFERVLPKRYEVVERRSAGEWAALAARQA